jgi:hypothetical protein
MEFLGGVPSHDTFNRVFSALDSDLLHGCLNTHGRDTAGVLLEKQICPDGKKLKVKSSRTPQGAETKEICYYISDEDRFGAAYFNALVRGHRGIENHLHWYLDVTLPYRKEKYIGKSINFKKIRIANHQRVQ